MKVVVFVFVAVLLAAACRTELVVVPKHFANKVDEIKSPADAKALLLSTDKKFEKVSIDELVGPPSLNCPMEINGRKVQRWSKTDLDENGYTDLLINGKMFDKPFVAVIMGVGDDKFETSILTRRSFQNCAVAVIGDGDRDVDFLYDTPYRPVTKKLTYRFGDLVELNPKSVDHMIEHIEYTHGTGLCSTNCRPFRLSIGSDRSARYEETPYLKPTIAHKGEIDENAYKNLIALVKYLDFAKLDDEYMVPWTDASSSLLKITYDGGKTKEIRDYGEIGTFGLDLLYRDLAALRENQTWSNVTASQPTGKAN